ncbi:hypothetical protein BGZ97_007790 [Linnemannia gamsii]|uniref:Uncharacterized protein n=1 Tax=Linnemannia gamsii TaxID=64522 RepID=A0A9P6QP40_9FUNG|nr:hypothetical protein BGZ97_007790 [Linnemannia gamsii]
MRMATVPRLQLLWGLLALFGSMAWLSMMPAYAFRWIILASNKAGGAKTNCEESPYPESQSSGYTAQCRGVNTAIVLDVIVFLLWIPIAAVIVCGTIERGLWWWGEDDGWAQQPQQGTLAKGGINMMSEEEFDLKIGIGSSGNKARGRGSQTRLSYYADEEEEAMESRPAFVTPIASQFRTSTDEEAQDGGDIGQAAPSSYRQHHQRRQQQQQQQQQQRAQQDQEQVVVIPRGGAGTGGTGGPGLVRKVSTTSMTPSISARLSTFFGQGWNSGPMPPPPVAPVTPQPATPIPAHHRPVRIKMTKPEGEEEEDKETNGGGDKVSLHGDSYTTQWHNRRYDEWS